MAFNVQKSGIEITAVDSTKAAFASVKNNIGGLTSQLGALTGLLSAGAFVAFTKRIIDQADAMNDLSKRTGIAVEQIGAWKLATEQSGTSMEALTSALGKGAKYLVQHGDNLKKIGINAKTSEELILQLSGVISKMPSDDPRRTALAMEVLGKSAGELIPLLSEGEQELGKMLARGRELNPVTKEMADNADRFNDSLAEMKLISNGLFVELVGNILPSFNTYLLQLKAVVDEGDWLDKLLFFTVGYVPGKIADKTERPDVQIQKYTEQIKKLKAELEKSGGTDIFGMQKDGNIFGSKESIEKQIAAAEEGLAAQRSRLPAFAPKHSSNPSSYDATLSNDALNAFLNPAKDKTEEAARKAEAMREKARAEFERNEKLKLAFSQKIYDEMEGHLEKLESNHLKKVLENEEKIAKEKLETQKKWFELEEKNILESQKLREEALEELARKEEEMARDIKNSLTDALLRGFENGNSFAKNFVETLKNMFKTLILQPTINFLLSPISQGIAGVAASLFSGGASASTGGGGGFSLLSAGKGIMDMLNGGNAAIVSSIESLGTFLSTGTGGLGDLLGGAIGQYAGAISNVLPFAGAAFSLLTGDVKGAVSQGIGAGIGLAIGGPIGGILGSVAGSLLGGMFGGGHVSRPKYYANTLVSSSGSRVTGAYGNSDADGNGGGVATVGSMTFASMLLNYAKLFGASVKDFNLGVQYQQKYDSFLLTVGKPIGNGSGYDTNFKTANAEEGIAETFLVAIKRGFIGIPDVLQDIVKRSVRGKGETALTDIQALASIKTLYDSLSDLPPVFEAIGYAIKNASLSDAAKLVANANAIGTYTSLFYTQAEQFDTYTKQITSQFDALGSAVPKSRDEFRKMVDGIHVVDKSTSDLFHGLVALAPAMDSFYKQIEQIQGVIQRDTFGSLVDQTRYQATASTYGSTFASDYTSNLNAGRIALNANGQASGNGSNDLVTEIRALRKENISLLQFMADTANFLRRWDGNGMPEVRTT